MTNLVVDDARLQALTPNLQAAHRLIRDWADMKGWRMWTMLDEASYEATRRESLWSLIGFYEMPHFKSLAAAHRVFAVTFWNGDSRRASGGGRLAYGIRALMDGIQRHFPRLGVAEENGVQIYVSEPVFS